jgi:hypothetical protein
MYRGESGAALRLCLHQRISAHAFGGWRRDTGQQHSNYQHCFLFRLYLRQAIKGGMPTQNDLRDDDDWLNCFDSRMFSFLGQVSRQTDFATASVQGREEVQQGFLQNLTIDLGDASIAPGTFQDDARATTGLAGTVGKWGGQCFGTPADGGPWGVTQGMGDNDWKMFGGFGAWKP